MSNDSRSVSGSIHVEQDGPARVALELMDKIISAEYQNGQKLDRKHYLTLYRQCRLAVYGANLSVILKGD